MKKAEIQERIEAMTKKLAQAFLTQAEVEKEIESLKTQIQVHQAYLVIPEEDEVDV